MSKSFINLSNQELLQQAVARGEGVIAANGALVVETGKRTGRSTKDRFIVRDQTTEHTIQWNTINQAIHVEHFHALWQRAEHYLTQCDQFTAALRVGADNRFSLAVNIKSDLAWHVLFARHLFIHDALAADNTFEQWTIYSASGLTTDPKRDGVHSDAALIFNFSERKILLCGMRYAGEIKKAMFSTLNYLLPERDVLPMHCAANVGKNGDTALFFGLSGTGKTTLSADPERYLIGDDEHGWSEHGIFNFEGGCYAKCINLSPSNEPIIWQAIRDGAVIENVIIDSNNKQPNYADSSLTENTRAAYPLEYIAQRIVENQAGHPRHVIFLTCDLYGVLPPVALLDHEQAAYHFLSGYTALVASTEGGNDAIKPTFSPCFGAPFFPRNYTIYAQLLTKRLQQTGAQVYLVNTGWSGGGLGVGKRFSIPTTRRIVHAILNNEILNTPTEMIEGFNLRIPQKVEGVETRLLNPKLCWENQANYHESLRVLIEQFKTNFTQFATVKL